MHLNKRRTLTKLFKASQFPCYSLIRISHSRKMKNKINRIYKRALRLVYDDLQDIYFSELLLKNKHGMIHQKIFNPSYRKI